MKGGVKVPSFGYKDTAKVVSCSGAICVHLYWSPRQALVLGEATNSTPSAEHYCSEREGLLLCWLFSRRGRAEELRRGGSSSRARVLFIVSAEGGVSVGKSVSFVVSCLMLVVYVSSFSSVVDRMSHLFDACGVLCAKLMFSYTGLALFFIPL